MAKVLVYSIGLFNKLMQDNNLNDDNVENLKNSAFISICGDGEKHHFKNDHVNVLNLDFEDVSNDLYDNNGKLVARVISDEQAEKSVKFINQNMGKDFYIHCSAGISRSQAFFRFITMYYANMYDEKTCGRKENPCEFPNVEVLSKLKKAEHKLFVSNSLS